MDAKYVQYEDGSGTFWLRIGSSCEYYKDNSIKQSLSWGGNNRFSPSLLSNSKIRWRIYRSSSINLIAEDFTYIDV
jgi:hypothetical protein